MAIALTATAAQAGEGDSMFRFSGFGSLGLVHSTEKNADFISRGEQASGAGYSHDWWMGADSRLGGQVDAKFSADWSAAVQATSGLRADNSYTPELSLAMLKWQVAPSLAVRAGRLFLPAFPTSDYREVSYAHPWVRPPVEIYKGFVYQHFDGADITGSTELAGVAFKAQAYVGKTEVKSPTGKQKAGLVYGAVLSAEEGSSSYRASWVRLTKIGTENAALLGLFSGVRTGFPAGAFGPGSPAVPGNPAVADEYQITDSSTNYFSVGYTYDPGKWFVMGEAAALQKFAFISASQFAYVTVGIRAGAFTPYATLARGRSEQPSGTSGSAIVDKLISGAAHSGQSSVGVGLRWDVMKNIDIKVQADHVVLDDGSTGLLTNVKPGFQPGGSFNLVSAAVSFVF